MTTLAKLTALPGAARVAELKRLCNSLRIIDADLALTLGITKQTAQFYLAGRNPVPNPVLVALGALEALPVDQREALITRRPRATKLQQARADFRAELAARPPLSAKQAGMQ
jgi:hypothetical protein